MLLNKPERRFHARLVACFIEDSLTNIVAIPNLLQRLLVEAT
jgi:hypothetical protein